MASLSPDDPRLLSRSPLRNINSTRFLTEIRTFGFSIISLLQLSELFLQKLPFSAMLYFRLYHKNYIQKSFCNQKRRMFCFASHELRLFITFFLYSYFSAYRVLGKNLVKIFILSVTLYCQSLCQIQTKKSKDRLRVDDNAVVKYINIKIASAGCTDKLLCAFFIQFDLFLHC